jgi:hypothetical protein
MFPPDALEVVDYPGSIHRPKPFSRHPAVGIAYPTGLKFRRSRIELRSVRPFNVAAWIEDFPRSKPTIKEKVAIVF